MKLHPSYTTRLRPVLWLLLGLSAVLVVSWMAPSLKVVNGIAGYVPLHTLMETGAIVVSMLVFGVGWGAFARNRPGNLLLLACVFFGVALLDFLHTISFETMPDFVTPSGLEKAINFWLAARLLSAFGLLAVAVLPWRPVADAGYALARWWGLLGVLFLFALVAWIGLVHADWLPRTFVEGRGLTPFKVMFEYFLVALFLGAAFFFLRNMRTVQPYDVLGLFAAVCTMALSELFFTLYSSGTDLFNLLGHIYKVIAYWFVYQSIFVDNIHLPYQRLNAANALLEQEAHERKQAKQALVVNEERLRMALAAGNHGTYDLNIRTGVAIVSPEYASMLGHSPDGFHETYAAWTARLHPEDRERTVAHLRRYLAGDIAEFRMEFRQRTRNNEWIWVLSKGKLIGWDAAGKPLRMLGTHSDVTARKVAESKQQLAASVFTHAREGVVIIDSKGDIVDVNAMFTLITGYSHDEAVGQNPRKLLHSGRHPKDFYANRQRVLDEKGYWDGEVWNRRKNGEVYAATMTISAVRDAAGALQNYVALFTDSTLLKAHQSQLEHIAHFDALTSMPNRVLLADRLQQAMLQSQRRNQSLAVAFLDLDGFKAVNDAHGHEVGDQLLIALSHRMKAALREGDTLARIGGDEFVALLVDLEHNRDCEPVLQRLLKAAADPVALGDAELQVSASVGVTLYPQDGAGADQLLRHADQAMYQAKQAGKNRYHLFDVAHDVAVQTQREDIEHLRRALNRQEFVLHYQPKVNMRTGVVIGAEALIRWQHPERGLLAPGAFLPAMEGHLLSVEVGEWVIHSALLQMTEWCTLGLDIPVSVNIGALQLQQDGFSTRLSALLAAHPTVSPGSLELEILETSALEDMAHISQVMFACQAIGVRFALDDFGTGYSSLTYLKRLPAELLKVDQSFVRDMLTDTDDLAIVRGVIGLAAAFRRKVIAEGVETAAHGQMLLSLGCELAQGYGIARPMPAKELPAWVATWQPDPAWMDPDGWGL